MSPFDHRSSEGRLHSDIEGRSDAAAWVVAFELSLLAEVTARLPHASPPTTW